MDQPYGFYRPSLSQPVEEPMELVLGHGYETTVIERHDRIAPLLSPDDAREVNGSPHAG